MAQYAYVRVSTREQNIDRQLEALKPFSLEKNQIFIDHQSGKNFSRPAWKKLVRKLKKGDLLIVKSIDRLGRNYSDILTQWQHITKKVGADILVLDMELLDTREKEGGLTGVLIADLVLQILAYVAQVERDFIRQRQAEGIAIAKANGTRFGRKAMDMPEEFGKVCEECAEGNISTRAAARKLGIKNSTFYRNYRMQMGK